MPTVRSRIDVVLSDVDSTRTAREELYVWFHQHPELSMQEHETSARIAAELRGYGVDEVVPIGGTGMAAIIRNGEGPVVAMRADFDALPVREAPVAPYSATDRVVTDERTGQESPAGHACAHDVHTTSLLSATQALARHRRAWAGTFLAVFQPAEETAEGARDLVRGGIAEKLPKPDVYLGQHVFGVIPGGSVGTRPGPMMAAAASIEVTIHGAGSHGSMPYLGVDPIVIAASVIMRLQTIVSRELNAFDAAVVTVGSIHGGSKSNIIPDDVVLQLNTRAFGEGVEAKLHEAIERIVTKECEAAGAPKPPEFRYYDRFPFTRNDAASTEQVRAAFDEYFEADAVDMEPLAGSEDFSIVPNAFGAPYVYWALGGFADHEHAPGNHSPNFVPDLQPTLDRGMEAIIVAVSPWLMREQ